MKAMTSTQAQRNFGKTLATVSREPVVITRRNIPVCALLSLQQLHDLVDGELAKATHNEGYIGVEGSERLLRHLRNH